MQFSPLFSHPPHPTRTLFLPQVIQFVIAVSQVAMVQLGGSIMQTVPLSLWQWGACVSIGSLSLVWGIFIKALSVCLQKQAPKKAATVKDRDE